MADDEMMVPGPPGIACEAAWGRKRAKAVMFIGRVYERADGGGMELRACDHQHATQAEAAGCAVTEADAIVAGALARCEPPGMESLRQEVIAKFGMPVE